MTLSVTSSVSADSEAFSTSYGSILIRRPGLYFAAVTVDIPEAVLAAAEADPDNAKALMGQVNYAFSLRVTPENADLRGGNNLPAPAFAVEVAGV